MTDQHITDTKLKWWALIPKFSIPIHKHNPLFYFQIDVHSTQKSKITNKLLYR